MFELLAGRRLTGFDFLGFGLSEKPRDVRYSLLSQADIAAEVARRSGDDPVVLVAHDMGTSVATELLARALEDRLGFQLAGVLLFNGSMVIERASLTLAQKALRSRIGPLMARFSNERSSAGSSVASSLPPITGEIPHVPRQCSGRPCTSPRGAPDATTRSRPLSADRGPSSRGGHHRTVHRRLLSPGADGAAIRQRDAYEYHPARRGG